LGRAGVIVRFFWLVGSTTLVVMASSHCGGIEEYSVTETLFPGVRPGAIGDWFLGSREPLLGPMNGLTLLLVDTVAVVDGVATSAVVRHVRVLRIRTMQSARVPGGNPRWLVATSHDGEPRRVRG
jgi:hypothetical protein